MVVTLSTSFDSSWLGCSCQSDGWRLSQEPDVAEEGGRQADHGTCDAGLWGLDDLEDPETAAVLQKAQEQPDLFVLKPQREGGGNNLYGQDAQQKLQTRKGLSAYILMQRIRPPINR